MLKPEPETSVNLPDGEICAVVLNSNMVGYGNFSTDPASAAWLIDNLPSVVESVSDVQVENILNLFWSLMKASKLSINHLQTILSSITHQKISVDILTNISHNWQTYMTSWVPFSWYETVNQALADFFMA